MSQIGPNSDPHSVPETGVSPTGEPGFPAAPPSGPDGKPGFFSRRRNIVATAAIAVVAVAGITVGVVASGSSSATTTASASSTGPAGAAGLPGGSGAGSNARTTNEPGGTAGTVSSVTGSSITVKTTVGETVTVDETSSTAYQDASSGSTSATTASASAITAGAGVLVLGTVDGTTITASQVTIEPAGSPYTTASADVSAMQKGQQNTTQTYGTIPADYTERQGTIVDSSTSDKAVTAALAEYPGGIVDRVVQLSDGDYEVHDIGTNMHHIFENSSFQVIGAN